ncbi:MAG: hypothetical protein OES57_11735 [Acidimicrobiia bacterium]|nr:hypothetical protein [Acidimicrobiia bacterium]
MTRWAAALVTLTIAALAAATLNALPVGAQDERPPVVSITPNEDLVDGQLVTLRAARFTPDSQAAHTLCDARVLDDGAIDWCDLSTTGFFSIGPRGRGVVDLNVKRVLETPNGAIDCGRPRACLIGVGTGDLPTGGTVPPGSIEAAWRYLRFAPGPLPRITGLAVESVSPDVVEVSIVCQGSGVISMAVSMSQSSGGDVVASGSGRATLRCTARHEVRVAMADRDGRFRNGPVEVVVDADGPGNASSYTETVPIEGDRWYDGPATLVDAGARLSIKRTWVVDDEVRVRVHLRCTSPTRLLVGAQVGQLVRDGVVQQDAVRPVQCDGPTDVVVPVRPINVFLTRGRANVRVSIIGLVDRPVTHLLAVAPAEIDSLVRPKRWTQPAQTDGPARVGIVTTTGVPVAAECDTVAASVSIRVLQREGRRIAVTETSGAVPCTDQLVTLDPARPLQPGAAVLKVRTSLPGEITDQVFRRRVR